MKKIILLLMMGMFLISLASAETSFYIRQNSISDVKFSCEINGAVCSSTASCNITINYPNSSVMIDNNRTQNQGNGYFNISINKTQTAIKGEYNARAWCSERGLNGTSVFVYEVNPAGIRPSDQKTSSINIGIYFIFGIGIILFIAFLFVKSIQPLKWTFFIFSFIFMLIGLNIIFVNMSDAVVNPKLESFFDNFTAISTYMYWFAAGLLIIIWAFTFINTWLYKKNLENIKKYGGEML